MTFNGLLAQDECRGDLAVSLGERHQTQDFYLAPGQTAKGASGEARCRIRSRRRLIAGEREGDGLVQRMWSQKIQRPDHSASNAQLPSELQTFLQPLPGGGVVAARRRDSPEHAQRQNRSPARTSRLQSGRALVVERRGADNVTLLK